MQLGDALEGFLIKMTNLCYPLRIANHWLGNFGEDNVLLPLSNKIYEIRKKVFTSIPFTSIDKRARKYNESLPFVELKLIYTETELLTFVNIIAVSFSSDQYGLDGEIVQYLKKLRGGTLSEIDVKDLRDVHSEALNVIKIMQIGAWQKTVNLIKGGIRKVGTGVIVFTGVAYTTYNLGALGILLSEAVLPTVIHGYLPPPIYMGITMAALSTRRGIGILSYGCEFLLNTGKRIRNFISPESRYAFPSIDLDKMEISKEPRNVSLEDVTEAFVTNVILPPSTYREYLRSSYGPNTPPNITETVDEN